MNCDEFWEKSTDFVGGSIELPPDLKEHISNCSQCEKEFYLIHNGLINLRKETREEVPAILWHEMKNNIDKNIKIPYKIWNFKEIWKLILVPAGVAISLSFAFLLYNYEHKPVFYPNYYETNFLVSEAQIEDMLLQNNFLDSNESYDRELNSAVFDGITDDLAAILINNSDIS